VVKLRARLEDWLSLRPALVHVYEGPVAVAGRNSYSQAGGNHFAWLLLRGSVVVTNGGKTVRAEKGQWVIAYPGARRQDFTPGARIISIQFQAKWPDGCNLFEQGLSAVLQASAHPKLEKEARRLLDSVRGVLPKLQPRILGTPLTAEQYLSLQYHGLGFLTALTQSLSKEGLIPSRVGQTDERLLGALRQLDRWPLDHPFRESVLAKAHSLSPDHLARRFSEAFGASPTSYFENRRRDYARRLLGHSAVPIKEIAGNLGFRALADFSSWFKRAHGSSPRAFRSSQIAAGYL